MERPTMAIAIRSIILGFIMLTSECFGQSWSPSQTVATLPSVSFQFRVSGVDQQTGLRAAEWVFENTADTAETFIYHLISDARDTLVGCTVIGAKAREFSGWLIHGERFILVTGEPVPPVRRN